jgi:hypothetical protein
MVFGDWKIGFWDWIRRIGMQTLRHSGKFRGEKVSEEVKGVKSFLPMVRSMVALMGTSADRPVCLIKKRGVFLFESKKAPRRGEDQWHW